MNARAEGGERVALEVAEADFDRMCIAQRIDVDVESMNDEDRAEFLKYKRPLVRAIQEGSLIVAEDGTPTYTPPVAGAESFTFYPPTGATYMAMDKAKDEQCRRMVLALTEMTRSKPGELAKLGAADFQICTHIGNLFLGNR